MFSEYLNKTHSDIKRLGDGMKKIAAKDDNKYKETFDAKKHFESQLGCEIKF